jgi:uncharacterized protein (TIGR02452 family)
MYISIVEVSTLNCACHLSRTLGTQLLKQSKIGVLNFASVTKPGGGFINGAQGQEESIARASNLYPSLMTKEAQRFYDVHKSEHWNPYYTHNMIYSPGVQVFWDEDAKWEKPISIDVVTSTPVIVGEVRESNHARQHGREVTEKEIVSVMRERMGRILFLFEINGVKNLVLGTEGLRNEVYTIARLWAELLSGPASRFGRSFDRVFFAILGKKAHFDFGSAFNSHVPQKPPLNRVLPVSTPTPLPSIPQPPPPAVKYCLFSIRCSSRITANCELSCQKCDVTPIFEVASWDVTPNIVGKSE